MLFIDTYKKCRKKKQLTDVHIVWRQIKIVYVKVGFTSNNDDQQSREGKKYEIWDFLSLSDSMSIDF